MDDVMGLIDRAHHGDERARAQLVEQNMGLVWSIVRRFAGRGYELAEVQRTRICSRSEPSGL